ncbi:hypothetical protein D3C85_1497820 [compost metagenome]
MALQVNSAQARDFPQPWQVEAHHLRQVSGLDGEAFHAVIARRRMQGRALVPVGLVQREIVTHGQNSFLALVNSAATLDPARSRRLAVLHDQLHARQQQAGPGDAV